MWKNAIRTQMFNANLHKNLRFLRPSHKKETVFLEEIYAYYVMSSRKLSDVNMFCLIFYRRISLNDFDYICGR